MVTLRGQAERLEVASSCGHRYGGPDREGAVSFVPAQSERRLRMRGVVSEWASISISPGLFEREAEADGTLDIPAFTNADDGFVQAMVIDFARLNQADRGLDPTYCDAMSWALAQYLMRRYGEVREKPGSLSWKLAPWRVRRVQDYIEAHLAQPIRVGELARLVGVSPGYFQRAFRQTMGRTPLDFINARRVQRAIESLNRDGTSIAAIAHRVGFISPSHFTRTFRQITGVNPSTYRSGMVSPRHPHMPG